MIISYVPAEQAPPFWAHQVRDLEENGAKENHARWWEMRTGKTGVTTCEMAQFAERKVIDGVIIVAWPGAVPDVWVNQEVPLWMPRRISHRALRWRSSKVGSQTFGAALSELLTFDGLSILAVNPEAMITRTCWAYLLKFTEKRRTMFVGDEVAGWCSNPASARAKRGEALARRCVIRRILDGAPCAEAPFDLFSQCNLLRRGILGYTRVEAFRSRYGRYEVETYANGAPVLDGYGQPVRKRFRNHATGGEYHNLIGYQHLDELKAKLLSIGSRVLRSDCVDLPPKLYETRRFELSPTQRQVYDELEMEFRATVGGDEVTVKNALARDGRLSMVARGWWPPETKGHPCQHCQGRGCEACDGNGAIVTSAPRRVIDPAANPALDALRDELEAHRREPTIVWCRHRYDCHDAVAAARAAERSAVRYDGSISHKDRDLNKDAFQSGQADVFVATPAAAGMGVRLDRAEVLIYYSCNYSARLRAQSEDRAESLSGRARGTLIVDLVARGTIDEHVAEVLRRKAAVAAEVTGDR